LINRRLTTAQSRELYARGGEKKFKAEFSFFSK